MRRSTKIRIYHRCTSDAFHPAALRLSRQILTYTARIIRRHKQIGSLLRKLNPVIRPLPGAGLPAQRRDVRRAGRRFRRRHRHRAALRHRDDGAAGRPGTQAALGAGQAKDAGYACLVIDGTDRSWGVGRELAACGLVTSPRQTRAAWAQASTLDPPHQGLACGLDQKDGNRVWCGLRTCLMISAHHMVDWL